MALTNFAGLTQEQLTVWERDTWQMARNNMFLNRFLGTDENSMIQRITELTKTKKGARAVLTLVNDLVGDGTAGDRTLEGNEEALTSDDEVIQLDQLRHANRHKGRMAEQASVVRFREQSRNKLAYWLADRSDQLAFLALSGVNFSYNPDGTSRVGSDFPYLEFASDVKAPTANRHVRWDGTSAKSLVTANTASVASTDTPTWNMLVEAKAMAKESYIRPLRGPDGMELYNVFMTPTGVSKLKQDADFQAAYRSALPRSKDNPLFKGTDVIYLDGLAIYEYRHVYHPSNWGSGSNVKGQRVLMCGAQAMGFADIGQAEWIEKGFDYDNQQGISVGKIMGMLKPQFHSIYSNSLEDFGVLCIDTAA